MDSQPDCRPLVAALANPHAREVFARIVLGQHAGSLGDGLGAARLRSVLGTLTKAGLVTGADDGFEVRDQAFRELLAAQSGPARASGPERFLDATGMIERFPASATDLRELLELVTSRVIDEGEVLSEPELNGRLRVLTRDPALVRRHLVDHGFLRRTVTGSEYSLPSR